MFFLKSWERLPREFVLQLQYERQVWSLRDKGGRKKALQAEEVVGKLMAMPGSGSPVQREQSMWG